MDDAPRDYYDPHPLVVPAAPIALAGFPGARVDQTARMVSLLTGLPLVSLDRAVEHHHGVSLVRMLAADGGARARTTAEAWLLRRVLGRPRPAILALGEATVLDPGLRWLLQRQATLVHLRQGLDDAVASLRAEREDAPDRQAHLFGGREPDPSALRSSHAELTTLLDRVAPVTVEVAGRHPSRVAQEVIERLGLAG